MQEHSIIQNLPGPIVILGAGGFIGRHLLAAWQKERPDVYGVGHYANDAPLPPNFLRWDLLLARPSFFTWLTNLRPRVIVNLLSYGNRPEQEERAKIWAINVELLHDLHAWWQQNRTPPPAAHDEKGEQDEQDKKTEKRKNKRKRSSQQEPWDLHLFIQAGSSSEYGLHCENAREDMACLPLSEYGRSKLQAAYLIQDWAWREGFPGIHVRFFSIYGPGEASYRLMPTLLREAAQNNFPPLAPPTISRDFVYIDDLVEALSLMAGQFSPEVQRGQIYNLCSGHATTLEELSTIMHELYPQLPAPTWQAQSPRPWEPQRPWVGNGEKTKAAFNWTATTSIKEGLTKMAAQMTWPTTDNSSSVTPVKRKANDIDLSVVIPLYQDKENIAELRRRLPIVLMGLDLSWEIVLIDDASPEIATWEAVQAWAAAEKRVKGLRLAVNLNSQGAILVGLQHCQGRMAVMMDSDLQDPPELIPALVKAAQEGNEVVYGFCQSRQEGVIMRIARFGFYQLLSFLHGRKYPRAGNFCLFNTNALQAAQKLTSIPFWRTWRMTVGGQQTGVPFVRPPRFAGKSHNHLLSNIRWALLAFISMPNFIAEYILILGTLIIGVITFFHPMVWPIMLLAEFFLAVQYLILRYLATMHERPRPPWPLIDKINLFEN